MGPKDEHRVLDTWPERSAIAYAPDAKLTPEQQYILSRGWSPVEFLREVYLEPLAPLAQRVVAAKALLEYAHRAQAKEVVVPAGAVSSTTINVGSSAVDLKKLSDADLATLDSLLSRAAAQES
jgi:hypothetical protein